MKVLKRYVEQQKHGPPPEDDPPIKRDRWPVYMEPELPSVNILIAITKFLFYIVIIVPFWAIGGTYLFFQGLMIVGLGAFLLFLVILFLIIATSITGIG